MSNWSHKPNGRGQKDFGPNRDTMGALGWILVAFIGGLLWYGLTK